MRLPRQAAGAALMDTTAHDAIGIVAAIVAMTALVPYVRSILAGRTRPSRASWFIWTVVGLALAMSYRASGATATFWVAVAYFFIPLIVFLLSIRYGDRGASRLDWFCLAGALFGLLMWWWLRSAPVALYINIAVDCLGSLPTVRKAFLDPASEDRLAWVIAFLANAINLLAIDRWEPSISLYPVYAFAIVGLIAALLCRPLSDDSRVSRA